MAELRKLKVTEMNRLTVEEFKEAKKIPLVVVLDDVRSLHNIGAVFRTSDAFLVDCSVRYSVHRMRSWSTAFIYAALPLLLLIRRCTKRH